MTSAATPSPHTLPQRQRLLFRLRTVVGLFATIVLAGLIAAELFAWLLPQRFMDEGRWANRTWAMAFFLRVFQHYIGAATLVLAGVLLFARWRRVAVTALGVGCVVLFPYIADYVPKQPPAAASPTARVMSINLFFRNRDAASIMRAIDAADPDVLVLIELTPWLRQAVADPLIASGRYMYSFHGGAGTGDVLSRLPARVGSALFTTGSEFDRKPILIQMAGKEVAVYPVHFVSPGRSWLVERNQQQATHYHDIAKAETHPTIIVGDCNFTQLTPSAYNFRRAGLRSTHEIAGFGLGSTWGPRWWPTLNKLPGVRIDHIWLSPQLTATSHTVGLDTGSDHWPVIADVGFTSPR